MMSDAPRAGTTRPISRKAMAPSELHLPRAKKKKTRNKPEKFLVVVQSKTQPGRRGERLRADLHRQVLAARAR